MEEIIAHPARWCNGAGGACWACVSVLCLGQLANKVDFSPGLVYNMQQWALLQNPGRSVPISGAALNAQGGARFIDAVGATPWVHSHRFRCYRRCSQRQCCCAQGSSGGMSDRPSFFVVPSVEERSGYGTIAVRSTGDAAQREGGGDIVSIHRQGQVVVHQQTKHSGEGGNLQ